MYNKRNLIEPIIEAIQDKKGRDITLIDLSAIEGTSAAKFIICTGNTPTQVAAIADNIRQELLDRLKVKPYNYDGYRNSKWIVLDYGETMIHVFVPDFRQFYNLEELWSDAPTTVIENLD